MYSRGVRVNKLPLYVIVYHRLLITYLKRDSKHGIRSSGGCVKPDMRLEITLCLLYGESYLEFLMGFELSVSSVYDVFHNTNDSIVYHLSLSGLPFFDTMRWISCSGI